MFLDLTLSVPLDHPFFGKAAKTFGGAFFSGHVGTHLDTPLGRPIPLDRIERQGVLIDARAFGHDIGPAALASADIREGDFVIFFTGHLGRHDYVSEDYFADHPQLEWSVIEALTEAKASLIGIDAPAIRCGAQQHTEADVFCEECGTYVIENIANLDELYRRGRSRFPLRLGWIGHKGMTGNPVKLVADLTE